MHMMGCMEVVKTTSGMLKTVNALLQELPARDGLSSRLHSRGAQETRAEVLGKSPCWHQHRIDLKVTVISVATGVIWEPSNGLWMCSPKRPTRR